jgi:hypothetical protein
MKFNYGKIFLLGFGFFGVSVIWGVYNAFVPIFLSNKFHLAPAFIGFFMTLDNIAALFIQPPVGRTATSIYSDRCPRHGAGVWFDSIGIHTAPVRGLHQHIVVERGVVAYSCRCPDAGYHAI